jgi:hypothetical protein
MVVLFYVFLPLCFGPYLAILMRGIQFWLLEVVTLTTDPLFCIQFSLRVFYVARFYCLMLWQKRAVDNSVDVCVGCYVRCLIARSTCTIWGHVVVDVVAALCYKTEGRGLDSRTGYWDFSIDLIISVALWP